MESPFIWTDLIEQGALYFIIGLLTYLLLRQQAEDNKERAERGEILNRIITAIELLKVGIEGSTNQAREACHKIDRLMDRQSVNREKDT
jgi:hypothetical protein